MRLKTLAFGCFFPSDNRLSAALRSISFSCPVDIERKKSVSLHVRVSLHVSNRHIIIRVRVRVRIINY